MRMKEREKSREVESGKRGGRKSEAEQEGSMNEK